MYFNILDEVIDLFKDCFLNSKFGMVYLYSIYGYMILGSIIEKVIGEFYVDYMKENVWSVVGMFNIYLEIFG